MLTEDRARDLLRRAAEHIPVADQPQELLHDAHRARRNRLVIQALMATAAVVLVLSGAVAISQLWTGGERVYAPSKRPNATVSDPARSLDELTGKELGLALGLTPDEQGDEVAQCSGAYAEYDDSGAGFCLAGVTNDPVQELIYAYQITGCTPTDAVNELAAALVKWADSKDAATAGHAAFARHVGLLMERVERECTRAGVDAALHPATP